MGCAWKQPPNGAFRVGILKTDVRNMKKWICVLLSVCLLAAALPLGAAALETAPNVGSANPGAHYFYDQLTEGGKKIYNAIWEMFSSGLLRTGTGSYDLLEHGAVTQGDLVNYVKGTGELSRNFSAAKDAFDLEHPEAFYLDSSYLCLRVSRRAAGGYTASLGPGRGTTYYVEGLTGEADVRAKEQALNETLAGMLENIRNDGALAAYNGEQRTAYLVRKAHDAVTRAISYRFEDQCQAGNMGFIRTLYAVHTHEGVCEGYARTLQYLLNELDVPCVLIHGIQSSGGQPEAHMWNAVQIGGVWYEVDPTWDDPVGLDKNGNIKTSGVNGRDGGENQTYLLVGRDVTGQHWEPSGQVSSDGMEFTYPVISPKSFAWGQQLSSIDGLNVTVEETEMEGLTQGKFRVSYLGMGTHKAAEQGYYLLDRICNYGANGVIHFADWNYVEAGLYAQGKPVEAGIFHDTDTETVMTLDDDYVEFAITTLPPRDYTDRWEVLDGAFYYHGDGSDIIAETGAIYNPHKTDYEPAPYVKTQYPAATGNISTTTEYRARVEFTDDLVRAKVGEDEGDAQLLERLNYPPEDEQTPEELLAIYKKMAAAEPSLAESWYEMDFDDYKSAVPHVLRGDHTFSQVTWLYDCPELHQHSPETCPINGVEFTFKASEAWADDMIQYVFDVQGLVGKQSGKVANSISFVATTPSCVCCYRSQGIDWNLWGQPNLLDNPDDLDLSRLSVEGVDGSRQSLEDLQQELNGHRYNGRLALVVEDLSDDRLRSQEITDTLEDRYGIDPSDIAEGGRSLYEINFTRLCCKVVINDGQSLRLQVGFPGGYTADSNVVFKAYHFTRNDNGDIISVEEIPVAVTPYGLVVLCNSFSPFEIVALDPDSPAAGSGNARSLVIHTDGNGMVLLGHTPAVGERGIFQLQKGGRETFTVKPDEGFALDMVSINGSPVATEDGRFTVAYDQVGDSGAVVNVSFVPQAVKDWEAEQQLTPVVPVISGGTEPLPFTDVAEDSWYRNAVEFVYERELMAGVGNDLFAPDKTTTRAEIVSILYRLEGSPQRTQDSVFTDLAADKWYTREGGIEWAAEHDIVQGYGNGRFGPDDPVTREQLAQILYNYAKYCKGEQTAQGDLSAFPDHASVSKYHGEAMRWIVGEEILKGTDKGLLNPTGQAKRSEVATLLRNFIQQIVEAE